MARLAASSKLQSTLASAWRGFKFCKRFAAAQLTCKFLHPGGMRWATQHRIHRDRCAVSRTARWGAVSKSYALVGSLNLQDSPHNAGVSKRREKKLILT